MNPPQNLIAQGAEAKILLITPSGSDINSSASKASLREGGLGKPIVIKHRIKKSYRLPEIDKSLIEKRTRSEIKILEKASEVVKVPIPEKGLKEKDKIKMPFIQGEKFSDYLNEYSLQKQKALCKQIGEDVAKLHNKGIIHGDLTTSNMIYVEKEKKIYFIDFGLAFISNRYEDKAVDLHLLRQALEAKHFAHWQILFEEVLKGYKKFKDSEKVITQLEKVEKRGRYKH